MKPAAKTADIIPEFKAYDLKTERLLSKRMNIWLISYDTKKVNGDDLLFALRSHPLVSIVQYNHFLDQRDDKNYQERNPNSLIETNSQDKSTTPNDPRFSEQWALNNTGTGGGTPDADIDAPEAWDYTTGGVTALGDTIVVAVIDGGAQLTHPDLNFWVNRFEIPNNGIDDDLNGYVDDYLGWNAYSNNGTPDGDSHGTHVSGIVAARGNNSVGVSGVNWNTKVMIISGSSSSEATVVAAYGFALEHRATYNETNGAKGAFVVSTNASFGVDYGQPANFPIWCAMYDSLGKYGILSCGATANLGIDIDLQGDIPTACPSPWLVSVTNTTKTDTRNSGAGYGLTTIDLGSPGTSILSTDQTSTYTLKTGTSMATPTVAGAIALMISAANPGLLQAYRTNPGATALLFKQYLLDATDPIPALQGQTVTGGRLNVFNAVFAVGTPPDTVAPTKITDLSTSEPTSNTLKLSWTAPLDTSRNGVVSYLIRKSNAPILTQNDFTNATPVSFPGTPHPAGSAENLTVKDISPNSLVYFAIESQDNWGNTSLISNSASGTTLQAPVLALSTHNLIKTVPQGSVAVDSVIISNSAPYLSTLSYNLELANSTFPDGSIEWKLIPNNPLIIPTHGGNPKEGKDISFGYTIDGMGGPDSAGYKWIDSREPNGPVFNWEDISITGTELTNWIQTGTYNAKDEGYSAVNLGFPFKYYGQTTSSLYAGSNGFVSFAPTTVNSFTNSALPSNTNPNGLMAAFWDDLDGSTGGQVFYKNYADKSIIQYKNWQIYSNTSSSLNFQIVLYRSGKILYQYQNMTGTLTSASVGIENQTGTVGLGAAYNSNFVQNNLAVQFQANPDWLTANNFSGTLYNGNSVAVGLSMSSVDLPLGTYTMDLIVNSNDLAKPIDTVKISMINTSDVPVELTSFAAVITSGTLKLTWNTATETNNFGFEVEKKGSDGLWSKSGFVKGLGTTTEQHNYQFIENQLKPGKYSYRLKQLDLDGSFAYSNEVEVDLTTPGEYALLQNYPNPFNPETKISYQLPIDSKVKIDLFSVTGQLVSALIDQPQSAGYYNFTLSANNLTSGVYLLRLSAVGSNGKAFSQTRKVTVLK
jgi:hypothetical protein